MCSLFRATTLRSFHKSTHLGRQQCPTPGTSHLPKDGSYKIYKYLTLLVGFPAIGAAAVNCYQMKMAEEECFERPPFVKYETMRRRNKRFPWGDGTKTLFHNPKLNPLPDGYEELDQPEE